LSGTTRLRLAAVAAVLLLLLVLLRGVPPLGEIPRRIRSLAAFAPKELAVRRLGGSGTAFDRRYFSFLENARRRLPQGTSVVFLREVPPDETHLFLATYALAPRVVAMGGPEPPLPGSAVAVYGRQPSASERAYAVLPEGFLMLGVPR
jgi:hypothetical protein